MDNECYNRTRQRGVEPVVGQQWRVRPVPRWVISALPTHTNQDRFCRCLDLSLIIRYDVFTGQVGSQAFLKHENRYQLFR